jgi:hypothetical protein
MTCIHGLGSSDDYMICDIHVYDPVVNLNDHEPNFDHRPLTLTLNFVMRKSLIEVNYNNQKHLIFDKDKVDILKDLDNELNFLSNKDNIEDLYHKLTITLLPLTSSLSRCCVKRNIE